MTVTVGPNGRPSCLDGRYRLIEQLGRGGTASVWRAHDERLGRTVAVKVLHPAAHAQGSRAEAQALARLSHPHIANVFDYGGDDDGDGDGQPYLVMELVQGRSLAAALADDDLSWPAVVAAVAQVTSALAAAHERGLVHRDVTPANIMLTPSGAKLIDFGISAVEGQAEADPDGGLRGTPAYVAPERLRGDAVAPASDVYSLGLVLYRALSGRLPWRARDARELWAVREVTDPEPLPAIDGLPDEVAAVCLQCLARDPADRPETARLADVLAAGAPAEGFAELSRIASASDGADDATQLMAPLSTKERSAHRRPAVTRLAAAGAALAAVTALGWSATTWSPIGGDVLPEAITAAEPPSPVRPSCDVTFQLAADDGQRFDAAIIATPRETPLPTGWRLSLRLATGGVDADPAGGWAHDADTMTSPAQPAVDIGSSARLTLSGSHTGTIALPTRMAVDGRDCDVVLLASAPPPAPAGEAPTPPGQPAGEGPPLTVRETPAEDNDSQGTGPQNGGNADAARKVGPPPRAH